MAQTREERFASVQAELGYSFAGEIQIGGDYVSVVHHGNEAWVSGQIPRVGNTVVATGRAGVDASLEQAKKGAKVSAMRALALLAQTLGSLDRVKQVLRVTVYVQCGPEFTQQSEVADGASQVLHSVLGDAGKHTRTSVGVYQLPKNATVEIDLVAAVT